MIAARARLNSYSGVRLLTATITFLLLLPLTAYASIPGVPGTPTTGGSAYVPVNKNYTMSWSAASGTVSHYELLENDVKVYSGSGRSKVRKHSGYGRKLYKVRACNVSGCGAYSSLRSVVLYTAPGSVRDLVSTATSVNQGGKVTLSWTAPGGSVPGVTYHVTQRTPSGVSSKAITTGRSISKTLSSAGTYNYTVVACNPQSVGCGGARSLSVTSKPPKPGTPGKPTTGGSAYVPVNNNYTMSWSAASGTVSRYELLENDVKVYSGSGRSKVRKHSGYGRKLYKVRACNVSGCGAYSSLRSVVLYTAPGSVRDLVSTATSVNQGGKVTLSWTAPGGSVPGVTYHVTQRTPSGVSSKAITTGRSISKTLSSAGTYNYTVVACNPQSVGCGGARSLSVTSKPPKPGTPGKPTTGGSAYVPVNNNYTMSWSAASGTVSRYELLENDVKVYSGSSLSTVRIHSDYGSKLYKVRACNVSGCGAYSSLRSVVLYTAPGSVRDLAVSSTSVNQGEEVTVNWNAPGGSVPGVEYRVTVTEPGGTSSSLQMSEITFTQTLASIGDYVFTIIACNPQNTGCGASQSITVSSTPVKPAVPGVPETGGSNYIPVNVEYAMSWTGVGGSVSEYELSEFIVNENKTNIWKIDSTAVLSVPFTKADYGHVRYKVRACNQSICSDYSPQKQIAVYTAPGPVRDLAVSSTSVNQGEEVTVNWNAPGGSVPGVEYRVTVTEPGGTSSSLQMSEITFTQTLASIGDYVFTIIACNPQNTGCGSMQRISVSVSVSNSSFSMTVEDLPVSEITVGRNLTIQWSVDNAVSCIDELEPNVLLEGNGQVEKSFYQIGDTVISWTCNLSDNSIVSFTENISVIRLQAPDIFIVQ